MIRPSLQDIIRVATMKNYAIFDRDFREYNLNIWAIRSADDEPQKFNDLRVIFYKYRGQWSTIYQDITTDPGLYYRNHPMNIDGTGILKEGQMRSAFKLGMHQNRYQALVQAKPVTVIRDPDRDNYLDWDGEEQTGIFGCNHHGAKMEGESTRNNKWSAMCQVAPNWSDHRIYMRLCVEAEKLYGPGLSYTLINENDL